MSNPYKRIKSIVEHDRAEREVYRLTTTPCEGIDLFLPRAERTTTAKRWLGWAKQEMRRHGCI